MHKTPPRWLQISIITSLVFVTAVAEASMGRKVWGISGKPGLWSGDVWSEHNSQYVLDPYSFTHISHGAVLFGILKLGFSGLPTATRLILAVGIEAAWEVLENTDMVINRYRAETMSLNYYGDSIVNSTGDVLMCVLGFLMASRLPARATVVGTIILEVVLAFWIRDNLSLNVLMLLHPSEAVRMWQLGR